MKKRKIISVMIVLVLIAITVVTVYRNFFNDQFQVLRALNNTLKESHLAENFKVYDTMKNGDYTISVSAKKSKTTFNAAYAVDRTQKVQSLSGDFDYDSLSSDFQFFLKDQALYFCAPKISDQILSYNYKEEKNGLLAEFLEGQGISLDDIDRTLNQLQNPEEKSASPETFAEDMKKFMKKLTFEEIDSKQCSVYGEEKSCEGYSINFDQTLADEWNTIYQKDLGGYHTMIGVTGLIPDLSEMQHLKQINLYISKKQVAEIDLLQEDGNVIRLELLGGSIPLEQIHITDQKNQQDLIVDTEDYSNSEEMTVKIKAYQPEKETKGTTAVISISKYADIHVISEEDAVDVGQISVKEWGSIVADFEKWKIKAQLKKAFF